MKALDSEFFILQNLVGDNWTRQEREQGWKIQVFVKEELRQRKGQIKKNSTRETPKGPRAGLYALRVLLTSISKDKVAQREAETGRRPQSSSRSSGSGEKGAQSK